MESLPNIREAPCRAIHPPTLPASQSLIYIVKPDQTLVIISEIIPVLDNGPELISLEVVLVELVVLHNYSGAPGLVRGGPAEIKSPCLDVSQDKPKPTSILSPLPHKLHSMKLNINGCQQKISKNI